MREDGSNWFHQFYGELPSPEELTPLSQSLISPNLAQAFNIPTSHHRTPPPPPPPPSIPEFDSPEVSGVGGSDEPARTLKRPRLVWTPQLHKRFVDAVGHLGIKNAVPKTIMQLMSVDGLTRENVASHLQKYRLYLKRMQGMSNSAGGGGNNSPATVGDPATDHLFATSPVPARFLHPGAANSEHFVPFFQAPAAMQHPPPALQHHPPPQFRQFGAAPVNGQFEHPFLRQQRPPLQRMGTAVLSGNGSTAPPVYVKEFESSRNTKGRQVLTLFPTGDD